VTEPARPGRHAIAHRTLLERLGRTCARHARWFAATWVVIAVMSFAISLGLFGNTSLFEKLSSGNPSAPGDAQTAADLLGATDVGGDVLTLLLDKVDPTDTAVRTSITTAVTELGAIDGVLSVASPVTTDPSAAALVATDRTAVLVPVTLAKGLTNAQQKTAEAAVDDRFHQLGRAIPGSVVSVGGITPLVDAITGQVETDLRVGESIALPVSLLVMTIVFGGFLAAGMPVVGAIASIGGALLSLFGFVHVIALDASVVNVVTILGLALCIDYGLLMVSRYREEIRRGHRPIEDDPTRDEIVDAVGRTVAAAGRTVMFSAITVAVSLCGMLLFQASILRALGAAGISVVVVAFLVALTFVPAMIGLAGRRLAQPGSLNRVPGLRRLLRLLGDVPPPKGVFSRLTALVQRVPWLAALAVVGVLVFLALPARDIRLTSSGAELLPVGNPARTTAEQIDARFPALRSPDVQIVTRASQAEATSWATALESMPGVRTVDGVTTSGDYRVISLRTTDGPMGDATRDVVTAIRAGSQPAQSWVGGGAAFLLDFDQSIRDRAPWAIGMVVVATFVLLFLMTGSVVIPLKALLCNIVSLGASMGVLVWVFQHGHLTSLLDFDPVGGIEVTVPVLMLAFAFGLAMDYEVFLLARILEHHRAGESTNEAVANGLQATGRIITCAALLVVIVFTGFVAGKLLVIKETGTALAVAVAIDATLVRLILVPATMTMLGRANWWAPGPLRRLHNRIGVRH
jgi:RND superfamily putative drug exporter